MNGEENRIMDEPKDSSIPSPSANSSASPLENAQNDIKDTNNEDSEHQKNGSLGVQEHDLSEARKNDILEDCDVEINDYENSNNSENSNNLDSETSQDPLASNNAEHLENDSTTDIGGNNMSVKVPENNSNSYLENCVSSNGSYSEYISSNQAKPDSTEQPQMCNIDEKNIKAKSINTNENSDDEVDSEEDSSDEGSEMEPKAEDTVSINTDSEPEDIVNISQDNQTQNKSDIIILENERAHSQNGNSDDSLHPEIQEILSDNEECVVAEEKKVDESNSNTKVNLRRSSRAIKRKRYTDEVNGDDESDIEEVAMLTPMNRKSKPIVINDTKALVEMAAKQIKSHQNTHKKEPTVVIIDTKSPEKVQNHKNSISSTTSAQQLYQSIVARGTTVTPVSSKSKASTQSSSQNLHNSTPTQPPILPSLTDDMFVVEAPSFIVPYVYEKPSIKPFREFVDILGKELEEQKAKEEKEIQEKKLKDKEKHDKDKQERKERGEEVDDSDGESAPADASASSTVDDGDEKKKKKKEKRKRNDDDDASWDGDTSVDSDDEVISDEEGKTVIIKDKADSIEEIKEVANLTADKVVSSKSDNYFDCSLGKFFINIGLSLVQEYVQTDLLKQQTRKLNREKKSGQSTRVTEVSIASLKKNLEFSKENNAPYSFKQKKCEFCSFKSESMLAMSQHLDTPHMKNNVYKCNFCTFETRSPHDILFHMEAEHKKVAKLERAPAYHQCANCPFEDNGKNKLVRHLIPCAKKFKPETNLAPPVGWEPPAKIPKISRSRNNMAGPYPSAFNRGTMGANMSRPMHVAGIAPGAGGYRARGRSPMASAPRAAVHGVPIVRSGVMLRHNAPVLMPSNYPGANNPTKKSVHQPSISITPLPRQPQPQPVVPAQPSVPHDDSKFVICEICDGYIKDLEQLRNHMQWIHKVKIHPKMIYNRPPLNCQKCQFRFFTDQGLERHLLGSHGLVTSSMQEAANKLKDAGRCPVCGRVYQWRLLNHVARDHNLTLKPAHLSYKCTVCTATFGMYKQFESHVYSAHSVVAKRVMDKSKGAAPTTKTNDSLLKPLKINDEITIIPQPVKAAASAKDK